jgi:hypothetical protein
MALSKAAWFDTECGDKVDRTLNKVGNENDLKVPIEQMPVVVN